MKDGFRYQSETRYNVLRLLAEGGMGQVFLAEQLGINGFSKTVAIKVIKADWMAQSMFRDLLVSEAKLVADLIHENILQVYHLAEFEHSCGVVMEYIHGCTLDEISDRLDEVEGYMPPDLATFVISRVARALAYAHEKLGRQGEHLGIVHRDVSPSNVMVSWEGVVKLADFGIAKAQTMKGPDEKNHVVGKVPFLSPEQVRLQGADFRSDLYSLGLVWYELLTGRTAYPAKTLEDLEALHQGGLPIPASRYNGAIPPEIDTILFKLIAHDPTARYASAREVFVALEQHLYAAGYGPTNEKLRDYLQGLFPEVEKTRIVACGKSTEPAVFRPTVIKNRED